MTIAELAPGQSGVIAAYRGRTRKSGICWTWG